MGNQRFGNSIAMTVKRQMANFDALPAELRAALRDTVTDWCAYSFHLRARNGVNYERQLARLLEEDARERCDYHAVNAHREARAARGEASPPRLFPNINAFRDAEQRGQARLI
jgi:hypothetical protein